MKNIYIAASPLQVICAYELSQRYRYEENIICPLLFNGASHTNLQMMNTLELFSFDNVKAIKCSRFLNISYISIIIQIILLRIKLGNSDFRLILGDFRDSEGHFARIIFKPKEIILVDDGLNTYISWNKYLSNYIFFHTENKTFKYILTKLGIYNRLVNESITIFSVFSQYINDSSSINNDFTSVKKLFKQSNKVINKSLVFQIGTKLSERGGLSLPDELNYLKQVYEYWTRRDKKIAYIAKRTTSEYKLKLIEKIGFIIKRFDYPLELYLLKSNYLPNYICGFGSSLFITLPTLFPQMNYICTRFPIEKFNYKIDIEDYNFFVEFSEKTNYIEWIDVKNITDFKKL